MGFLKEIILQNKIVDLHRYENNTSYLEMVNILNTC
jgi:hypothetical protein